MNSTAAHWLLFVLMGLSNAALAQKTTFYFFRHAEKEMTSTLAATMDADPPLSARGVARAATIPNIFTKLTPYRIYTTAFQRTRATIHPLAVAYHLSPETYDPKQLKLLADSLKSKTLAGKTVVIVGHSNTNYKLINLMMDKEKLPPLPDSVYNKYWVLTRKKNGLFVLREKAF